LSGLDVALSTTVDLSRCESMTVTHPLLMRIQSFE
jgi:hypothetical protein